MYRPTVNLYSKSMRDVKYWHFLSLFMCKFVSYRMNASARKMLFPLYCYSIVTLYTLILCPQNLKTSSLSTMHRCSVAALDHEIGQCIQRSALFPGRADGGTEGPEGPKVPSYSQETRSAEGVGFGVSP